MKTIGFIGFGNIAQAMAKGFLLQDKSLSNYIYASGKHYDKCVENCKKFGIHACTSNHEVVNNSDIVVLAVKPYVVQEVLKPLYNYLTNKMLVSAVAGLTCEKLNELVPSSCNHISTNPNIPVACGNGITICEEKHNFTNEQYKDFELWFTKLGSIISVETKNFSIGCSLAGCGPAFMAMIVEALGDAGVKYGLTRPQAYAIACQMMAGSGSYLATENIHPAQLKDAVCSPGGTTIKGVSALEENGLRHAIISAFDAIENK